HLIDGRDVRGLEEPLPNLCTRIHRHLAAARGEEAAIAYRLQRSSRRGLSDLEVADHLPADQYAAVGLDSRCPALDADLTLGAEHRVAAECAEGPGGVEMKIAASRQQLTLRCDHHEIPVALNRDIERLARLPQRAGTGIDGHVHMHRSGCGESRRRAGRRVFLPEQARKIRPCDTDMLAICDHVCARHVLRDQPHLVDVVAHGGREDAHHHTHCNAPIPIVTTGSAVNSTGSDPQPMRRRSADRSNMPSTAQFSRPSATPPSVTATLPSSFRAVSSIRDIPGGWMLITICCAMPGAGPRPQARLTNSSSRSWSETMSGKVPYDRPGWIAEAISVSALPPIPGCCLSCALWRLSCHVPVAEPGAIKPCEAARFRTDAVGAATFGYRGLGASRACRGWLASAQAKLPARTAPVTEGLPSFPRLPRCAAF